MPDKFTLSQVNLHYDDFHALKDVNLNTAAKRPLPPSSVPVRLRQEHPAQVPQPHERPGARLQN